MADDIHDSPVVLLTFFFFYTLWELNRNGENLENLAVCTLLEHST